MQRIVSSPPRPFSFHRTRLGESARKAAVLVVVVAPFIATAAAFVQLWQWAVTWRDLALLIGLYLPISLGVRRASTGCSRTAASEPILWCVRLC